ISNDSGHYQPPKTALHELVLRLVQASVFADNAMVKYFVPEKRKYETVTVQVFLQPSKPVAETSPAVPSSQAANSTWTPGRVHGNHVAIGGHRR
ncbi:MAG TPA: hypothetical protein PLX97_08460, partial [Gemmatales bacterium]|nr:hypothetical protein [Gemmatales bacterium]